MDPTSLNDLCAAVTRVVQEASAPEPVPKGWMTVKQFARAAGVQRAHAGTLLSKALSAGAVERRLFRIQVGSVVRPTAHYKAKA